MRLALLALACFAAISLYRTIRPWLGTFVAFTATAIAFATPSIAKWGWYAMTELPTLAFLLGAGWGFSVYLRDRSRIALALAALSLAGAVWCKQPGAVGALWLGLAAIFVLGIKETLVRKEIWVAFTGFVILSLPIVFLTLNFGAMNLEQSVSAEGRSGPGFSIIRELTDYPRFLVTNHLSTPVAVVALCGLAFGIARLFASKDSGERKSIIFFLCLIIANYLFFTALNHKIARYGIFWVPAFSFFAALLIDVIRRRAGIWVGVTVATALIAFSMYQTYETPQGETKGMAQAANYITEHADTPIVLVDSYINGQFIYFMRQRDPDRRFWVIRGDKVFTSSSVNSSTWLQVYAKSTEDIRDILNEYGVKYIVVDKNDLTDVPIHRKFRDYLRSADFKLLQDIPMESNRDDRYNNGQSVQIYEYVNWQPPSSGSITIRLPIVGKEFVVPFKPEIE